ncbi:MAG: DUF3280 domain-containing protein [Alphaproteobacteria bacterium]|nr:DUF3280 domain-containing protein [Alphaproteobacteria bacterium]
MIVRFVSMVCAFTISLSLAEAAPKTAVFPFELSVPALHPDDLMFGTTIKAEEQERLKIVTKELRALLAATGQYEVADLTPLEKDIEDAAPLHKCNGCETELAKKAGVELAVLPMLEKSSDTLLNMSIGVLDVASGRILKTAMVVIQGNTEESWIRAVRWLVKRKFTETKKE